MSDKITSFPSLPPLPQTGGSTFSPQGTGGFASQFTGDIFTSRGRFGNGTNYLELTAQEIKSANYVSGSAGWRIAYDGTAQLNDLTLTGGTIQYGKTSFTDSTNAGYFIGSSGFYFGSASDSKYLKYNIITGSFDLVGSNVTNPTLTGIQSGSEISIQGWVHTMTFSATDYRTVAWTSGVITLLDGSTFNISSGNTGNMSAATYIYLAKGTSQTVLQTSTTPADAVGTNRILVCVAQNVADTAKFATFQDMGKGKIGGTFLGADNIAAGVITANEIAANTITANKIATGTLTANEISTGLYSQIDANLPSDTNLAAYWNFDEGTGLIANDASGNGHTGTLEGSMTSADWVAGVVGTALDFDGTDDYVDVGTSFSSTSAVVLWASMDNYASSQYEALFQIYTDTNNRLFIEHYTDNTMRFYYIAGGVIKGVTVDVSAYSGWHQFGISWSISGNEMKAYIDGTQVGTTQTGLGTWAGSINNFVIGNAVDGAGQFFNGKIDEVRVYSSALTAAEVYALYKNPAGNKGVVNSAFRTVISGSTTLADWRASGDLTKINGGNIYTGSVTTTQLAFVPVQSTDVVASINASMEGITIDAGKIEISGSTTFSAGYNPSTKLTATGGSYASAASGARVLVFPDANTGIQVIDDAASDVFKAMVGGTNVGDVVLGDYTSGKYAMWDKSASSFDATGVRYIQQYTAGETITAPKVVCYKKANYDTPQDGTTGINNDSMTDSSAGNTNLDGGSDGSNKQYSIGTSAGVNYRLFYGFNVANSYPDKVLLRFYGNVQTVGTLEVYRITADWDESTLTHNNKPATTTLEGTGVPTKTLASTGWQWIEMDITNIVRGEMWGSVGDWTLARGIMIYFAGGTGWVTNIRSKEYTVDTTQRPILRITKGIDLETELFIASNAYINLARKIVGMNITDGTDGNSFNVQFGGVVSGLSGLTAGQEYYLGATGTIDTLNNLTKIDGILTRIGTAISTTTLRLEIEPERFLWQSQTITLLADDEVNYVFAPIETNECVIHYNVVGGNGSGTVTLKRKGLNTIDVYPPYDLGGASMLQITYTWDDTNNKITITNTNTATVDTNHTFYFYK